VDQCSLVVVREREGRQARQINLQEREIHFGGNPDHARITAPLASGAPRLVDAWSVAHPGEAHAPTVGLYEESWPVYCCDFVFVTEDLVPRVRAMTVDSTTDASDHQPVILELADG
jgi:endonuclease/exonuclease/phosphatase family metal-dependent hydrolase